MKEILIEQNKEYNKNMNIIKYEYPNYLWEQSFVPE